MKYGVFEFGLIIHTCMLRISFSNSLKLTSFYLVSLMYTWTILKILLIGCSEFSDRQNFRILSRNEVLLILQCFAAAPDTRMCDHRLLSYSRVERGKRG